MWDFVPAGDTNVTPEAAAWLFVFESMFAFDEYTPSECRYSCEFIVVKRSPLALIVSTGGPGSASPLDVPHVNHGLSLFFVSSLIGFVEVYTFDPLTRGPAQLTYNAYEYKTRTYSLKPTDIRGTIKIVDSFNNVKYTDYKGIGKDGTMTFTYKIPKEAKGGEYTVKVESS